MSQVASSPELTYHGGAARADDVSVSDPEAGVRPSRKQRAELHRASALQPSKENDDASLISRKARPMALAQRRHRVELRYLEDPVKLADHVLANIRKGKEDKALDLIREASKDFQCTVSWNHVINREMRKGRINAGIKLYNEVSET
jgi:hypothetical protein